MWTYIFFFLCGVLSGIGFVGAGLWYVLSFFFHDPDSKETEKSRQQIPQQPAPAAPFQLPPVLLSKISDESCKTKESCWAVNFILYFLFRELKNSEGIRRWVLRKLALEFDELLASSVLGKFFSSITIQNIDLGHNFPVVNWLRTSKVEIHPVFKSISTLDILVDLDYSGGFQFSIQAESHLKHSAYLSVQFKDIKGKARLQFSTEPYAHWSFGFAENPEIDISVVSQLYGKSFNQVTSIIAAQLKRSVRKKHTLPMYKIRYKPFFSRVQHLVAALVPNAAPRVETTGDLTLTIVECRGLMSTLLHSNVYATVGIAEFDWIAAYPATTKGIYVVRDVAYVKTAKREANLDFTLMQQGDVVVVESVNSSTFSVPRAVTGAIRGASFCPTECELEPGDEILTVDGKKVTTIKQCIKYFRNSTSLRVVWRIRRNYTLNDPEAPEASLETSTIPSSEADGSGLTGQASSSRTESGSPTPSRRNSSAGIDETESASGDNSRRQSVTFKTPTSATQKIHQLLRSRTLPFCNDPIFHEAFSLNVDESHRFLNITFWSARNSSAEASNTSSPTSSPSKKSKSVAPLTDPLPFGRDSVVGRISIPLGDIVSECSTTGMGYFVKDFYLGSPDGVATEARDNSLKDHSGFEPQMCYGKVTLSFLYNSTEDLSKRKVSLDSTGLANTIPNLELGPDGLPVDHAFLSGNEEQPRVHQFIRTHFRSSTLCDYCNKKIWLKEAYSCTTCGMKCHKKCNERCLANTICRGVMQAAATGSGPGFNAPEIITTESEPLQESFDNDDKTCEENGDKPKDADSSLVPNTSTIHVRRRTLGGLIVSAVQNRTHLRRAGSAATLIPPSATNSNTTSKSLPPSPQASPTASRKASMTTGSGSNLTLSSFKNPFQVLDTPGFRVSPETPLSQKELDEIVEQLIRNPNEDLVSIAKESGKELYSGLELNDRKQKLNRVLTQLQEEIDAVTKERVSWTKEESNTAISRASKLVFGSKVKKCEEKVQALVLLMLHFCAGLQHVHDLEESAKQEPVVAPKSNSNNSEPTISETATGSNSEALLVHYETDELGDSVTKIEASVTTQKDEPDVAAPFENIV